MQPAPCAEDSPPLAVGDWARTTNASIEDMGRFT